MHLLVYFKRGLRLTTLSLIVNSVDWSDSNPKLFCEAHTQNSKKKFHVFAGILGDHIGLYLDML